MGLVFSLKYSSKVLRSVLVGLILHGCSVSGTEKDLDSEYLKLARKPLPPEQSEELLGDLGRNWLYGNGLGETALNVGLIVAFPPYAIYLVGNALLSVGGYQELRISEALPEPGQEIWDSMYDGITSGPGRFTAAVVGEEYRSRELAKIKLDRYLKLSGDSDRIANRDL